MQPPPTAWKVNGDRQSLRAGPRAHRNSASVLPGVGPASSSFGACNSPRGSVQIPHVGATPPRTKSFVSDTRGRSPSPQPRAVAAPSTPLMRCHSGASSISLARCPSASSTPLVRCRSSERIPLVRCRSSERIPAQTQFQQLSPRESFAATERLQAIAAIQEKIHQLEVLEQMKKEQMADLRARAAARLQAVKTTSAGNQTVVMVSSDPTAMLKARAAARLADMGGVQHPTSAAYYQAQSRRFSCGSPGVPQLDSRWAVEDEIIFKPMIDDEDDDANCIFNLPQTAAETVADAMRALSPRREHSPLRFMVPVLDTFEDASRSFSVGCIERRRSPTRPDREKRYEKRSI